METSSARFERFTALGNQLIHIHHRLLDAVDDLRAGEVPPTDLAEHCLAFCAAVTRHHTGEDATVFPELARRFPELREALAGLERDHEIMAGMLRRVAELAGALDTDGARAELDGLAALLKSHFSWEEKRLAAALNSLEIGALAPQW